LIQRPRERLGKRAGKNVIRPPGRPRHNETYRFRRPWLTHHNTGQWQEYGGQHYVERRVERFPTFVTAIDVRHLVYSYAMMANAVPYSLSWSPAAS
jgi:hypothetical protein